MKKRHQALQIALVVVGVTFLVGIYPLMQLWPAGWRWFPHQTEYEQMIFGIYGTLGFFLLLAARNPMHHLSLIWFTVFSSLIHGGIMAYQAWIDPSEIGHFFGDIPALLLIALILGALTPFRLEPMTPRS